MENLSRYKQFLVKKFSLGGEYKPSTKIKKQISEWEGASMKTNRSFEEEAKDFNAAIPSSIKSQMSQEMLDGLFSYSYNVGVGKFTERVLPSLLKLYSGQGDINEVEQSMWANLDFSKKYGRGLTSRRNEERALVHRGYGDKGDAFQSNYKYDYRNFITPNSSNRTNTSYVPKDGDKRASFNLSFNKQQSNPVQTYLNTPIGMPTSQQYIAEEPAIQEQITQDNIPIVESPDIEVVSTQRPTFDLPIFMEQENPFLVTQEQPVQKVPNAVEQQNLLTQEYINRERTLQNGNILYNSPYQELQEFIYGKELAEQRQRQAIEDLRLKESLANISALGGQLFDPITNTFNPNNKLGDFNSKSLIPQVRY